MSVALSCITQPPFNLIMIFQLIVTKLCFGAKSCQGGTDIAFAQ